MVSSSLTLVQWRTTLVPLSGDVLGGAGLVSCVDCLGEPVVMSCRRWIVAVSVVLLVGTSSGPSFAAAVAVPPGAPTAVSAKLAGMVATVSWKTPASSPSSKPTSYTVTSSPAGVGCTVAATSCKITLPTLGVSYVFTVTASNAAGSGLTSGPSGAVVALNKPATPVMLQTYTENNGQHAVVSWKPVAFTGATVTYIVTSSPTGQGCTTTGTQCFVYSPQGKAYTFTVKASNSVGTSAASAKTDPTYTGWQNCAAVKGAYAGRDYSGCDFTGRNLTNVDFTATNLTRATLTGATLTGAKLAKARLQPPVGTVTTITTGNHHTCAVTTAGTARCWGNNNYGQTDVPADLGAVTTITAGDYHTCAVTTAGTARCWGNNWDGQTDVPSDLGTVTSITAGYWHTCAVTTAGIARCWGYNGDGQTDVPSDLGTVTSISAGYIHTCAVTTTGIARCWGYNGDGQTDVPAQTGTCGLIGTPASLPTGWSLTTGCLTKP